jgi:hypothetical protein
VVGQLDEADTRRGRGVIPPHGAPADLDPTDAPPSAETISNAFQLGWVVAGLHGPLLGRVDESNGHLPTLNELSSADRVPIALEEVATHLLRLAPWLVLAGTHPITVTPVVDRWRADPGSPGYLAAVRALHLHILGRLQANGPRVADAYSFGRTLCDTCWSPTDRQSFEHAFSAGRVAYLGSWLVRIQASLPANTAQSVAHSLAYWAAWTSVFSAIPGAWATPASDLASAAGEVQVALRHQGELWRSVLSGDESAQSFLTIDGYVQAAETALRRARHVIRRVVIHFWFSILVALAVTACFVLLAFANSKGTARVWSTIASVTAGLGVTGGTIRGGLQRLISTAGRPVWAISESEAIAAAITALPTFDLGTTKRHRLRREGVAAGAIPRVGGHKLRGDRTGARRACGLLAARPTRVPRRAGGTDLGA